MKFSSPRAFFHKLSLLVALGITLTIGMSCRSETQEATQADVPPVDVDVQPDTTLELAAYAEEVLVFDTTNDGRTVAQRLDDASTATRIRMALANHDGLRRFDFAPEVRDGRVALKGVVQTPEQRELAGEVVRAVPGVREVSNQITVTEAPELTEEPIPLHPAPAPAAPPKTAGTETIHTVRPGETLWAISRQYGVSVEQIQRLNGGRTTIRPGQRLRIR
jgi:LysM repeat protein